MNIKKLIITLVCVLMVAVASIASAQTFAKGTKVCNKSGKVICTLPSKCNLTVTGSCKINGKRYTIVKGKGKYDGITGYILESSTKASKKKDSGKKCYITDCDKANMRDKNGNIIAKIPRSTKKWGIFHGWVKSPTLKGKYAKVTFSGKTGYIYWDYIDIED